MNNSHGNDWQSASADTFWNEIARFDHVVQVYDNDEIFIDTLTGFVESAIRSHESAIVIATNAHLSALEANLEKCGHSIETLISDNKFIPVGAEDMLHEILINGKPDENKFMEAISGLLKHAKLNLNNVRAFGEMVAILWAQGKKDATLQLEDLWNKLCVQDSFCRYCAYPRELFPINEADDDKMVCDCHSKMISGSEKQPDKVRYRNCSH